mgnify:CR=1 FL=1
MDRLLLLILLDPLDRLNLLDRLLLLILLDQLLLSILEFLVDLLDLPDLPELPELPDLLDPPDLMVLMESPASLTFEMLDVPALAAACRERGVLTLMDNTWAAGLAFKPLAQGVDVSVQALTKYAGGHSDLLMGSIAVADAVVGKPIFETIEDYGWRVTSDDAWLALRGLRTLPLRYAEQARSALAVAEWLQARPEVARILHPALAGGHGRCAVHGKRCCQAATEQDG